MSDWQPPQQGQTPQPPAPAYAPPQAYQPPLPGYPPQASGPYPPGQPPKKNRTGLIIAVVLISLLLLCCCAGAAGLVLFRADSSTGTETISLSPSDLATKKAEEKELAARAAAWELVKLSFAKGDYTFVEPNERQRRLADATIAQVLPDFVIEELTIEPGHYDKAKDYYYFDTAFVTLVAQDASVRTAYSFDIETPEAQASGMTKEDLDLGESDAVIQLEGKTWVIYPTSAKGPLLGGMKDQSYGALIRQAGVDWPGGLPTKFIDQADGSVVVSVETWDSYRFSDDWNRIEATYVRSGSGWKVTTYKPVIESGKNDEASPTV
jgi:hypothetical protein